MLTRPLVVCALLCALAGTAAAGNSYNRDTDPVNQGDRALAEGRLPKAKLRFSEAVAAGHEVPLACVGLAEVAAREGRLAEAEAYYQRALTESDGDLAEAHSGLGLLMVRQGREEEGAAELARAMEIDKRNWLGHYGLARLYLGEGAWDRARAELEHGRDRQGAAEGEDRYHYGQALLLQGTGDHAGAEREALAALRLNPTQYEYGELVGALYREQDRAPEAIAVVEQALAAQGMPRTAPLLHQLGNLYRAGGQLDEARDRYIQAVAVDSTFTVALADLGDVLTRQGRHELAARTRLRYVQLAPDDAEAWLALCASLSELRRFDQARDAADHARQVAPGNQAAQLAWLRAAIRGTDDEQRQRAAAIVAAPPAWLQLDAPSVLALGQWQLQKKDYETARATLARAAGLDSLQAEVPVSQGLVELRTGHPAEAAAFFRVACTRNPNAAAPRVNLGLALLQGGQPVEAVPALREALALDPTVVSTRLVLAQALLATGAVADAAVEFREVTTREPRNAPALRGLGYALLRRADYAGAAAAYRSAADLEPDNADGWAGLGAANLGLENTAGARDAFARARQLDPDNAMLRSGSQLLARVELAKKESAK
jgi:tetratricopeptide (TPR) repeat protein